MSMADATAAAILQQPKDDSKQARHALNAVALAHYNTPLQVLVGAPAVMLSV